MRSLARLFFIMFGIMTLLSCGPRSLQDYRQEGESLTRDLLEVLYTIDTREDAVSAAPRLKSLFDQMVTLMIAARDYREKHPEAEMPLYTIKSRELSDRLRAELNRVFRIEDARDIVEKCQEDSLNRLDAYDKRHKKTLNSN